MGQQDDPQNDMRRAERGSSLDFAPMWLLSCCIAVLLVLTVICVIFAPQRAITMWNYASAVDCPAGEPASDCVATLPGRVTTVVQTAGTQNSTPKAVIHIDVPGAPLDTRRFSDGTVLVQVAPGQAEDLGITSGGEEVEVALFGGDAIEITGPSGESFTAQDPPSLDFLGSFLLLVGFGLLTVTSIGYAGRRLRKVGWSWRIRYGTEDQRVRAPRWSRPALISVGGSAAAGAVLGYLSSLAGDIWLVPVTLGVSLIGSIVLALTFRRVGGAPGKA